MGSIVRRLFYWTILVFYFLKTGASTGTIKTIEHTAGNVTIKSTPQIPSTSTTEKIAKVAVEGGEIALTTKQLDTTHQAREHTPNLTKTNEIQNVNKTVKTNSSIVDIHPLNQSVNYSKTDFLDLGISEKNDNKSSVPKKEAPLEKITTLSRHTNKSSLNSSTAKSITTTTTKPTATVFKMKPIFTESDDDDFIESKNENKNNNNIPSLDKYSKEIKSNQKRSAYIVPIVAVIFSVPLVAAIISILYKRWAEWWQHRNYRRMDFLIDGMYEN